jgi:hypothetical protein
MLRRVVAVLCCCTCCAARPRAPHAAECSEAKRQIVLSRPLGQCQVQFLRFALLSSDCCRAGHRSVLPEIDDAAGCRASNDANLEERHTGTVVGRRREQGL